MGINLDSYVSLAAGFDKNCSMLGALDKLGFGYIVGGTITLHPRPGNLKPRIKRYVSDKSMINALGFPNDGLKKITDNLKKYNLKTPLVLSISGDSNEEIIYLYETLSEYCSGFEINISSPNTEKLKFFHNIDNLSKLLAGINKIKNKPYMLKIPRFENLVKIGEKNNVKVYFWVVAEKYSTEKKENLCQWPFERTLISSDLRVVPCCTIGDPDVYQISNKKLNFEETWFGDEYTKFRESHLK